MFILHIIYKCKSHISYLKYQSESYIERSHLLTYYKRHISVKSAMSGKGSFITGTLDFGPIPNYLNLINYHDIHKNTSKYVIF